MAEKNQKRIDILTSARALFKENGFHNTKMEDIALKAGVGKGTLYEYFKNKQDMFDETCVEYVKSMHDKLEEITSLGVTFKSKLMLLFKGDRCFFEDDFENSPLDYIMSYKSVISEKVLKSMFKYASDINKLIISMIDQGKAEGVVSNDIPSEIIACSIVGTMGEYFKLNMHKDNYKKIDEEIVFNMLFNGFGVLYNNDTRN